MHRHCLPKTDLAPVSQNAEGDKGIRNTAKVSYLREPPVCLPTATLEVYRYIYIYISECQWICVQVHPHMHVI